MIRLQQPSHIHLYLGMDVCATGCFSGTALLMQSFLGLSGTHGLFVSDSEYIELKKRLFTVEGAVETRRVNCSMDIYHFLRPSLCWAARLLRIFEGY